jgi:hypothetical protein
MFFKSVAGRAGHMVRKINDSNEIFLLLQHPTSNTQPAFLSDERLLQELCRA